MHGPLIAHKPDWISLSKIESGILQEAISENASVILELFHRLCHFLNQALEIFKVTRIDKWVVADHRLTIRIFGYDLLHDLCTLKRSPLDVEKVHLAGSIKKSLNLLVVVCIQRKFHQIGKNPRQLDEFRDVAPSELCPHSLRLYPIEVSDYSIHEGPESIDPCVITVQSERVRSPADCDQLCMTLGLANINPRHLKDSHQTSGKCERSRNQSLIVVDKGLVGPELCIPQPQNSPENYANGERCNEPDVVFFRHARPLQSSCRQKQTTLLQDGRQ